MASDPLPGNQHIRIGDIGNIGDIANIGYSAHLYHVDFLVGGIVILILLIFMAPVKDIISMLSNVPAFRKIQFRPQDLTRIEGYLQEMPYYAGLSFDHRHLFLNRTISFIINKEIIGKEGLIITEKMRVQIAATAVQLTFGLKNFILPHFQTIYIFKGEFGYPGTGVRMKGGTSEGGKIYLSWKDFESGLVIPDDGYNLGLHEFAHAVKIEYTNGTTEESSFERLFPHWYTEGMRVMQEMKEGRSVFLRKYAATNPHEFFAVSVERFFETPVEFKEKLPQAYFFLSGLLQQDPASKKIGPAQPSYSIPAETVIPLAFTPRPRSAANDSWHWSLSIFLSGLLVGIPLLTWMLTLTDIPIFGAVGIIIATGSLNFISWAYFRKREILNKLVFTWYSYIGVGVWFATLVFALNYAIPVSAVESEVHVVGDCLQSRTRRDSWTTMQFNDHAYDGNPLLRTFYRTGCRQGMPLYMKFRRGIFGLRSLDTYDWNP